MMRSHRVRLAIFCLVSWAVVFFCGTRFTWLPATAEWLLECDEAEVDLREIHGDPPNWRRRWVLARRRAA